MRFRIAPVMLILITVDEQGFLPTPNEHVAIFSALPHETDTNIAPFASPIVGLNALEDILVASPFRSVLPADDSSSDFYQLLDQLRMTEMVDQQPVQHVTSDRMADERQAQNIKIVWGMSPSTMGYRHQAQQKTLASMPSGVESPGQIVEGPAMTPRRFFSYLARAPTLVPRGSPTGINTDCR